MITTLEFFNELKEKISFLDIEKKILDVKIELPELQIKTLKDLFISWSKYLPEELVKGLIVDVLKKPNSENGKVYEALVYAWLDRHSIRYLPQVHIDQNNCFKASKQGYDADGIIEENGLIFDVKQFGLTLPHIETLRRKLQEELPEEFYLTISGGRNISVQDIKTHFLEKTKDIAQCIMNEKSKLHTDYLYRDRKFGLEFRAYSKENTDLFTSISEFDLFEWAENNEFYFMYHASQFCTNSPYILFCPYDEQLASMFSTEDRERLFWTFRALCRRIFMNLTKMDDRGITDFDRKAKNGISVATAAKKISAIIFLDVTEEFDYQNCRMFVFQNPNADCKIPRYQMDSLFRYAGATIDDFRFDNY